MKLKLKVIDNQPELLLDELNRAERAAPALFYDPRSILAQMRAAAFRTVYPEQAV